MDATLHTLIATGCMFGAYFWGKYSARDIVPNIIESTLDNLEKEGFIETRTDKDGEKDIIKISEIRAKVLRDAYTK
tara:strand:- start:319 stop:546 length:228 start_codon:yes stop_codon:yes gene_type:complete